MSMERMIPLHFWCPFYSFFYWLDISDSTASPATEHMPVTFLSTCASFAAPKHHALSLERSAKNMTSSYIHLPATCHFPNPLCPSVLASNLFALSNEVRHFGWQHHCTAVVALEKLQHKLRRLIRHILLYKVTGLGYDIELKLACTHTCQR